MRRWVSLALLVACGSAASVAAASSSAIPGLKAKTIMAALGPQDFDCTGPTKAEGLATWTCTKPQGTATYVVTVGGASASNISLVRAVATVRKGKPDPLARTFFAYIATIPYTGWNPTKAQAWVTKHVAGGTTKFGRVTFKITAAGKKRTLELRA